MHLKYKVKKWEPDRAAHTKEGAVGALHHLGICSLRGREAAGGCTASSVANDRKAGRAG